MGPANGLLAGMLFLLLAGGCAPIGLSSLTANLNRQNDLELVCEGAPALLLMVDSLIANAPENKRLLLSGVQAYTAYADTTAECGRQERGKALSAKAHTYGLTLLRLETGITPEMPLDDLNRVLQELGRDKVGPLFWGAYGWALWITHQSGAPSALADLPRVELLMRRVVALEESYYLGGAHLFLGIYYGSRPMMLGGKPELARQHFERALAIGNRNFLTVQVAFAENYARPQQERQLYRQLLEEVLTFEPVHAPELTLSNLIAQRRAGRLLAEIDEYFHDEP